MINKDEFITDGINSRTSNAFHSGKIRIRSSPTRKTRLTATPAKMACARDWCQGVAP